MNESKPSLPHNITLSDRTKLQISGVLEVISFDENSVVLRTTRGAMTVEGDGLHVSTLAIDRGEVVLDGTVNGIFYTGDGSEKTGLLARLFG